MHTHYKITPILTSEVPNGLCHCSWEKGIPPWLVGGFEGLMGALHPLQPYSSTLRHFLIRKATDPGPTLSRALRNTSWGGSLSFGVKLGLRSRPTCDTHATHIFQGSTAEVEHGGYPRVRSNTSTPSDFQHGKC